MICVDLCTREGRRRMKHFIVDINKTLLLREYDAEGSFVTLRPHCCSLLNELSLFGRLILWSFGSERNTVNSIRALCDCYEDCIGKRPTLDYIIDPKHESNQQKNVERLKQLRPDLIKIPEENFYFIDDSSYKLKEVSADNKAVVRSYNWYCPIDDMTLAPDGQFRNAIREQCR